MHQKKIMTAGKHIPDAGKVLVMLHGRGGSATDILSLAAYLQVTEFALMAPEATNQSWYPFSFMVPTQKNEPWLGSALNLVSDILNDLNAQGIKDEQIYFLGFSQGACLTLEFVARHAKRYGGVVAFTGGLIGDTIDQRLYGGDLAGTPVFIGTSDPDPHVPVERVSKTAIVLRGMHAVVTEKVYPGMGHTISQDEIRLANNLVLAPEGIQSGI